MSSNGGGGACFEPQSFDHCEIVCDVPGEKKSKKIPCVRTCFQDSVRMCVVFRKIIAHHKNTTMESLSPLAPLGSSSAHPPTKKQRKEGMNTLL
jgi:hypothetical protein